MTKTKDSPQVSMDQFYIVTLKSFIKFLTADYKEI